MFLFMKIYKHELNLDISNLCSFCTASNRATVDSNPHSLLFIFSRITSFTKDSLNPMPEWNSDQAQIVSTSKMFYKCQEVEK